MRKIKIRDLFKRFRNSAAETAQGNISMQDPELLSWLGIDKNSDGEITYFTCMKKLSETIAKLPLKYFQSTKNGNIRAAPNRAAYLLTKRPNAYMTPTTFWGSVELNRNEYGNAYVLCRWEDVREYGYIVKREIKDLWLMKSNQVTVWLDDAGIFSIDKGLWYQYTDKGNTYWFSQDEVLHFKTSSTYDGIMGKPIKEILKDTISGAKESQDFLNNMYRQGMTASCVLHYTGALNEETENKVKRKYTEWLTGAKNAGKIVPMPIGFTLDPINTKLVDNQYYELKKYTALQVAAAFGIKPNQINNYEKSSYANSETQQLDFLVETISYILKGYEEEINYKLLTQDEQNNGFFFKFNEKAILRTNSKDQMEMIAQAVQNGLYTPNEGRDLLGLPKQEGGDILIANGNFIPITDVGNQYKTKGSG